MLESSLIQIPIQKKYLQLTICDSHLMIMDTDGYHLPDTLKNEKGVYTPAKIIDWCIENAHYLSQSHWDVIVWYYLIVMYDCETMFTRECIIDFKRVFDCSMRKDIQKDFPFRANLTKVLDKDR